MYFLASIIVISISERHFIFYVFIYTYEEPTNVIIKIEFMKTLRCQELVHGIGFLEKS
jgi:hypothetical protein